MDQEMTYGHLGLTTSDDTMSGGDPDLFAGSKFTGFDGVTPVAVLYHNGPSDGGTDGKGYADVAYEVQISAMQEAGDYSNTLTYICTPQF
jgi:hypothetical protein